MKYFIHLFEDTYGILLDSYEKKIFKEKIQDLSPKLIYSNSLQNFFLEFYNYIGNKREYPYIQKWFWPKNYDFGVFISHDIDMIKLPYIYAWILFFYYIKNKKFLKIIYLLLNLVKRIYGGKYFRNFKKIMEIEKRYGVKSTFYFMSSNFSYQLEEIKEDLINLIKNGNEVGLHADINSFNNFNILFSEKKRLENYINKKVVGCRPHRLKMEYPTTWRIYEKAGIKYSSLIKNPPLYFPFRPYDFYRNRMLDIIEIPITITEEDVYENYYKSLNDRIDFIKDKIKFIKKINGLFSFSWHNNSISDLENYEKSKEVYIKVLQDLSRENCWIATGEDIFCWWKRRSNTKISKKIERRDITYIISSSYSLKNMKLLLYNYEAYNIITIPKDIHINEKEGFILVNRDIKKLKITFRF